MKRVFVLLFLTMFLLSIVACDKSKESDNVKVLTDETTTSDEAIDDESNKVDEGSASKETTVKEQVVFDSHDIVITVKSIDMNSWLGPELLLLIENNSDQSVRVQANHVSVNGLMANTIFSVDVAPDKKANDSITLMLEENIISTIKEIELVFHIMDAETWNNIVDSEPIKIMTNHTDYVQSFDVSGQVAFDSHDIKITAQKLESTDSFWGADLYLFIENNSDRDVIIQTREVSINGFMVDPIFSSEVSKNKKAYDSITFFESDLTDNGITDIEEIELYFHIFDVYNWETIIDSEIIKITF